MNEKYAEIIKVFKATRGRLNARIQATSEKARVHIPTVILCVCVHSEASDRWISDKSIKRCQEYIQKKCLSDGNTTDMFVQTTAADLDVPEFTVVGTCLGGQLELGGYREKVHKWRDRECTLDEEIRRLTQEGDRLSQRVDACRFEFLKGFMLLNNERIDTIAYPGAGRDMVPYEVWRPFGKTLHYLEKDPGAVGDCKKRVPSDANFKPEVADVLELHKSYKGRFDLIYELGLPSSLVTEKLYYNYYEALRPGGLVLIEAPFKEEVRLASDNRFLRRISFHRRLERVLAGWKEAYAAEENLRLPIDITLNASGLEVLLLERKG